MDYCIIDGLHMNERVTILFVNLHVYSIKTDGRMISCCGEACAGYSGSLGECGLVVHPWQVWSTQCIQEVPAWREML